MYILLGILIGFVAAIPLGPVNVFVISQALKRDFLHGFMAGITAAVLDTLYCLVAILGIAQVTYGLAKFLPVMKVFAALLLAFLGYRLYVQSKTYHETKPSNKMTSFSPRPMLGVLLLYVMNPSLYIFWLGTAGFVTSHYFVAQTGKTPVFFSIACGIGGVIWYFILTHYVATHHHQFKPRTFQRIFLVLAVVLFVFAAYSLLTVFINVKLKL
ncbi:MAG: LysE family transporter [Candidatus Aminicenantes bacterium]|nr:LysE family transporter [Candidatus Aminicenantes bacterium]